MPTAISTAAAIAERCAGFGLGGRPESASMTGRRATVRPGHQAAAVAPTTARTTAIAIRAHGRLSRSMRWSTADSSVGANTTQSARPAMVPMKAATVPTTAPFVNSTRRRCFSVAPMAASMPSWRSRRCATTANPAAATSEARRRKTVATENISNVSAAPLTSLPRARSPPRRSGHPAIAEGVAALPAFRREHRRGPGWRKRGRRERTRRSARSGSRRCPRRSVVARRAPGSTRSRAAETPPPRR